MIRQNMTEWVMTRLVVVGLCIYGKKWDCTFNSGIRTSFSGIVISISGVVNENSGMFYPLPSSMHFSNFTLIRDSLRVL